ncbi:hypothetical protein D3C73_962960 [compost metagenome]
MKKKVTVRIQWVPTELGGKNRFPLKYYSTAAHFLTDDPEQDWSVYLVIESNQENYVTICDFRFNFSDRAPQSLIYIGSKFELFESGKVGDGEIIEIFDIE